jgi:alkylation response protein AidB-like acyl-CoA dehydrogenase
MTTVFSARSEETFKWWAECQPANFYDSDEGLIRSLEFYCQDAERLPAYQDRLSRFGASAATVLNEAAETSNRTENLPILQSAGGELNEVRYGAPYHVIGSQLYATGVMQLFAEPINHVLAMAFLHLLSLNGEAGHACPFACTAGVIKALSALGTDEQKQQYLPRLLDPDYTSLYHAAQYLTESQGGSDVGSNRTIAEKHPLHDGVWLLSGEKWFCTNVTAPIAVLTARPRGAQDGTSGLGLFLLRQRHVDGTPNGIQIIRLKEKLGTRSVATAEIQLNGAIAESLGPVDGGFKNMMRYVINTSRLCNCFFASGAARRAFITADLYATHRTTFGKRLKEFSLVNQTLALMRAKSTGILAASLCLARMLDDVESGLEDEERNQSLFRVLLNVSKYRSSVLARETVIAGIECLGGNGTIETFSVLPRLLRDCIVYETWEGPHNVLMARLYCDLRKASALNQAFTYLQKTFKNVEAPELADVCRPALRRVETLRVEIEKELNSSEAEPSWSFRAAMDVFGNLFFLARICAEADLHKSAGIRIDRIKAAQDFWRYICPAAP